MTEEKHKQEVLEQQVAQLQSSFTQLSVEENWASIILRSPRFFVKGSENLGGFGGQWYFHKADHSDPASLEKTFRAIRCYGFTADQSALTFHFFHEGQGHGGKGTLREQDGLYETFTEKSLNGPYLSCSMALSSEEQAEGRHPCFFWRAIPYERDFLIRLAPSLPPELSGPGAASSTSPHPSLTDPLALVNATWAFEVFIDDGKTRWSAGPIYGAQSRRLISNFHTQEHVVVVQPSKPIRFDTLPSHELRSRLSAVPAAWMSGGRWHGKMQEMIWDEEGEQYRTGWRQAVWRAPDPYNDEYRLIRYEDAMYGYYPTRLKTLQPGHHRQTGCRFEVGGLMRNVNEFRRVILQYSAEGYAQSLTVEYYVPHTENGPGESWLSKE